MWVSTHLQIKHVHLIPHLLFQRIQVTRRPPVQPTARQPWRARKTAKQHWPSRTTATQHWPAMRKMRWLCPLESAVKQLHHARSSATTTPMAAKQSVGFGFTLTYHVTVASCKFFSIPIRKISSSAITFAILCILACQPHSNKMTVYDSKKLSFTRSTMDAVSIMSLISMQESVTKFVFRQWRFDHAIYQWLHW